MFTNRIGDHHAWDSLYEDSATCHGIGTTHPEHHHQALKVGLCNSTSRYCASFIQFHLRCDTAWHITHPVCQCGCDGKHDSTQATTFAQDHSERYDLADAAPIVRRHTSEPRPSHEPVDLPLWILRPSGELVPSSSMLQRVWHLVSQVLRKHAVKRVWGNRRCVVELHQVQVPKCRKLHLPFLWRHYAQGQHDRRGGRSYQYGRIDSLGKIRATGRQVDTHWCIIPPA